MGRGWSAGFGAVGDAGGGEVYAEVEAIVGAAVWRGKLKYRVSSIPRAFLVFLEAWHQAPVSYRILGLHSAKAAICRTPHCGPQIHHTYTTIYHEYIRRLRRCESLPL